MSLLDDVSIVVTPNGYKAGELHAVIPVPTEGAEEITNGDFATDSDWSKATGVTISGGNAIFNNSTAGNNGIYQGTVFQANTQYKITAEVSNYSSGNVTAWSGSSQNINSNESFTGNGTKTWIISTGASNGYLLLSSATTNGNFNIDNVSVKEYTSADMDVTRATAATRVDENGLVNYALGVEEVTNGDFSNGSTDWTLYGSTLVVSNANPYNGNDTALFTALGVGGAKVTQSISTVVGNTYHLSCYVQYNSGDQSQIEIAGVLEYPNGIGITSSVTTFTYLQTSFTATSSTSVITVRERGGNNNASCYLYGLSVKEVNNVPRIDYTGGGCPRILAEPQRTNNLTASQDLTASFWNSISTETIVASTVLSPDGTTFGFKAIPYSGTTTHYVDYDYGFLSMPIGEVTYSIFVKPFGYTNFQIAPSSGMHSRYQNFELTGDGVLGAGDVNGAKIEKIGDWYRCSVTETSVSASPRVLNIGLPSSGLGRNPSFTGNGTDGVLLWGGQIEEGTYATSYIPTSGSTVTRNQDIFTRDGIGSLINSTEGVLFAEIASFGTGSATQYISITNDASSSYGLRILYHTNGSVYFQKYVNGTRTTNLATSSITITDFNKLAIRYNSTTVDVWANGVEILTNADTNAISSGTLNRLGFDIGDELNPFYGKVKQLQVYDTSLSDEQLLQLTGESGTDFYESYAEMASALTYTIQ